MLDMRIACAIIEKNAGGAAMKKNQIRRQHSVVRQSLRERLMRDAVDRKIQERRSSADENENSKYLEEKKKCAS